jgi:predicted transcriptional regulator
MGRRSSKRSRPDLFAAILEVISHYPEGARITKLFYGVGVPVDRLKLLVEKLCRLGLARRDSDQEGVYYGVTLRGLEFLDTFSKMKSFLEELGESTGN